MLIYKVTGLLIDHTKRQNRKDKIYYLLNKGLVLPAGYHPYPTRSRHLLLNEKNSSRAWHPALTPWPCSVLSVSNNSYYLRGATQ